MSSSYKTLIAAIVVFGLGGLAIWDGTRKEKSEKKADEDSLIVHAETAQISGLVISNIRGQKIALERVVNTQTAPTQGKAEATSSARAEATPPAQPEATPPAQPEASPQPSSVGQWRMLEPLKDLADAVAIQSVLSSLKGEKSQQVVAEGKDINWAVYGLDHPVVTLVITSNSSKAVAASNGHDELSPKTETIEIGGVKAYDSSLYARLDHQDKVLLVSSEWDVLLSKLPREYRDKRLLRDRDALTFTKLEFSSKAEGKLPAQNLILAEKNHKWAIDDGVTADALEPISELAVMNYLSQIKAARALEFVNDDKNANGALKSVGLDHPSSVLKLYPGDKSAPIIMQFAQGDKIKAINAATSSEILPIVNVYRSFVDGLHKPAKEFFDKLAPFKFKLTEVSKLQIQTKGSLAQNALDIALEKRGNDWAIATKGLQKQIDNTKLNEMIQRIGELEAVRFVEPIASVPKAHSPLPKKVKAGEASSLDIGVMSNHIRLLRADGSLVLELKWGDLLFEKSNVSGLSPEDAKLPGQVEAQFVATETNQSKWLMGVPEGSIRDLGIHQAIADKLQPEAAASRVGVKGSASGVANESATGVATGVKHVQSMPTVKANFEPVEPAKEKSK